jgi:hypothetical protein
LEPGFAGFRGITPCPEHNRTGGEAGQIVKTQGVYGTVCAFGLMRRGAVKKVDLPGFESAPMAESPGPILSLVNKALFSLPFFCRAWPVRLPASGQVSGDLVMPAISVWVYRKIARSGAPPTPEKQKTRL